MSVTERKQAPRDRRMVFFAENGKRPVRLSESTRRFAWDSVNHRYGLETREHPNVSLDHIEGYGDMTPLERYDRAITEIVTKAPVRICADERISGAATLGDAIRHELPARYGDEPRGYLTAVSHLTIDFETVLRKGVGYIREQTEKSLETYKGTEREPFLRSCLHCLDSMEIWRGRYLDALEGRPGYEANLQNLRKVPFEPAGSFYEAVQSLWFTFAFVRLCGNWPGIGRIDRLLGGYLKRDLASGAITIDEAREILAHFFIKGCEWICGGNYGSGDAQHYQNIVLAGRDENGEEVTNEVTFLVLDVLEELGISDFPTTIRISENTDPELLRRAAEVIKLGGGVIAVYNEDLILRSLSGCGYDPKEAAEFANDGCWEIQIPGKTCFSYIPFDSLRILQETTLANYGEGVTFPDFETLYAAFIRDLKRKVEEIVRDQLRDKERQAAIPCTVISLFEQGCVEKGLSYRAGGPVYHVLSPHIGGLPDVVNSLYAVKKLVFDEKKTTFPGLMRILRENWSNDEPLRRYAANRFACYGNDNDEADRIASDVLRDFADICDGLKDTGIFMTPAGVSTFGRQIEWAPHRLATPFGKKAGEVLAGNFSPTPGTDKEGATAIIKSYCKADLTRTVSGAALDIKLLPSAVNGENGTESIMSLIRGFVKLGGHFMQPDIADTALLKEAQAHPEDYPNLSVRVSGWNARFVTLNKDWQDMIIAQTGSGI